MAKAPASASAPRVRCNAAVQRVDDALVVRNLGINEDDFLCCGYFHIRKGKGSVAIVLNRFVV